MPICNRCSTDKAPGEFHSHCKKVATKADEKNYVRRLLYAKFGYSK